tara:strand:+ start:1083 stop:1373 length:291 start_codon:yes stop_codon:yes gene_type:complete
VNIIDVISTSVDVFLALFRARARQFFKGIYRHVRRRPIGIFDSHGGVTGFEVYIRNRIRRTIIWYFLVYIFDWNTGYEFPMIVIIFRGHCSVTAII